MVLYRSKKLSAAQLKAIQERARAISDKELGLLLINASYVSQQDIIASLQGYFITIINRLFAWAEGLFRFENNLLPPDDRITVRVNLENIIIEGARRQQEQDALKTEIPSLDIALRFTDRPGTNIRNVNLSVEEWKIVSYISPKNSLRQIAAATRKSDAEIRKIVYSLLQAGLVELVRPEGAPPPVSRTPPMPTQDRDEQKSLINRLISRIRSI